MALPLLFAAVNAYPDRAGGCEGNAPAVGGDHLDPNKDVVPGTLTDGVITVTIGGTVLSATEAAEFPIGEDLMIAVEAGDTPYLGVLVRLEAPNGVDTTAALLPQKGTQIAVECAAPIVGISHMDRNEKDIVTGTIRFDQEVLGVVLDVTVVFLNVPAGSAFVYNRLTANFRADVVGNATVSPTTTSSTTAPAMSPPVVVSPVATSDSPAPNIDTSSPAPKASSTDSPAPTPSLLETDPPVAVTTKAPVAKRPTTPGSSTPEPTASDTSDPLETLNPTSADSHVGKGDKGHGKGMHSNGKGMSGHGKGMRGGKAGGKSGGKGNRGIKMGQGKGRRRMKRFRHHKKKHGGNADDDESGDDDVGGKGKTRQEQLHLTYTGTHPYDGHTLITERPNL